MIEQSTIDNFLADAAKKGLEQDDMAKGLVGIGAYDQAVELFSSRRVAVETLRDAALGCVKRGEYVQCSVIENVMLDHGYGIPMDPKF
jgi:hypothetical protein